MPCVYMIRTFGFLSTGCQVVLFVCRDFWNRLLQVVDDIYIDFIFRFSLST